MVDLVVGIHVADVVMIVRSVCNCEEIELAYRFVHKKKRNNVMAALVSCKHKRRNEAKQWTSDTIWAKGKSLKVRKVADRKATYDLFGVKGAKKKTRVKETLKEQ